MLDANALIENLRQSLNLTPDRADLVALVNKRLEKCAECNQLASDGCGSCATCGGGRWANWQSLVLTGRCRRFGEQKSIGIKPATIRHGNGYPGPQPKPALTKTPQIPRAIIPPLLSPEKRGGPGTELKLLLRKLGIRPTTACKCDSRAVIMDEEGCDWCTENLDVIVGWLREAAKEQGLPFVPLAAKILVKRAIYNARKKERILCDGNTA